MKLGLGVGAGLGDGGYVEVMFPGPTAAATSLFKRINVEAKMATVGRAITLIQISFQTVFTMCR